MAMPAGQLQPLATHDASTLTAVLCGTFHRAPSALRALHTELAQRFDLLSPRDVDWVDPTDAFVRLPSEIGKTASTIEGDHLGAIGRADFVWLFCPEGYVGTSAAMEIGYAKATGVPVMSDVKPTDETFAAMVKVVEGGLDSVPAIIRPDPGAALRGLQTYYRRAAARRGWNEESARDTMLLLTEEVGELARAVRKSVGLARAGGYDETPLCEELADVQLYLVHLSNVVGIDLADAVTGKERVNAARHAERQPAA